MLMNEIISILYNQNILGDVFMPTDQVSFKVKQITFNNINFHHSDSLWIYSIAYSKILIFDNNQKIKFIAVIKALN